MLNSHKASLQRSVLFGLFAIAGCSHGGAAHAPPGAEDMAVAPDAAVPGADMTTTTPPVNADLGPLLLDVEPAAMQTITVTAGQTMPTVQYTATSTARR